MVLISTWIQDYVSIRQEGISVLATSSNITEKDMWPLLLTWFNFNPSMDK